MNAGTGEHALVTWRYLFIERMKNEWRTVVLIIFVVMASAALGIAIAAVGNANQAIADSKKNEQRLTEYIACKADYDERVNARTKALTEVSATERVTGKALKEAQSKLVTSPILNTPADARTPKQQQELLALFQAWQSATKADDAAVAAADKERAAHPVPDPPSKVCGEPPKKPN